METRSLKEQIDDLLASLEEEGDEEESNDQSHGEDKTMHETAQDPTKPNTPNNIVSRSASPDAMEDETFTIESTIEPLAQEEADQDRRDDELPQHQTKHTQHSQLLPFVMGILSLLVIAGLVTVTLLQWFEPIATITIIPVSTTITSTTTIPLVSGNADPARHQLMGRMLSSVTMSQSQTVATTGVSHIPAQAAHGTMTFYNAALGGQTIAAGTLLTGADGVQVVTDQDAMIPAAVYPTFGQTTISAHAVVPGVAGNIQAGDIYGPCCRLNVSVINSTFHGGQDARITQTVAAQDIDNVGASLTTALVKSAQAVLAPQVQPTETLVPPQCSAHVTTDHHAGEEATQVRVTVDETCAGEVYDTQAMHDLATQISTQDAARQVGDSYIISADPQLSITRVSLGSVPTLDVKIVSTWLYQFSQAQQAQLKQQIVGKSQAEAKTLLVQMKGIQSVEITIKNGSTIPADVDHIHLVFLVYPGGQ